MNALRARLQIGYLVAVVSIMLGGTPLHADDHRIAVIVHPERTVDLTLGDLRAIYLKQKKDRKARQREHTIEIKQIKYRPAIDGHDFETKTNKVRKFLAQGHKVKITIMFRSRDIRRPENGYKVLERVAESVSEVGFTETKPGNIENRNLTMVLAPLKKDPPPRKARPEDESADSSSASSPS